MEPRLEDQKTPQVSPPVEREVSKKYTPERTKKELQDAISGAEDMLIEIRTPFLLFPSTLSMDRARITVKKQNLFSSTTIFDVPIEDTFNVVGHVNLILGWVRIDRRILAAADPHRFGPFWRRDALRFSSVAQGYIIALQRKIDLNSLSTSELRSMLHDLGRHKDLAPTNG